MWLDRFRTDTSDPREMIARLQHRVFRQAPYVVWTSLRGETVVFDIEHGKYESLNEVATSVWERIVAGDQGATFDSILSALQEEYELPAESSVDQMATDVAALLTRLEKARTIVSEPLAQVAHS
jgi:hypothetical protein